MIGDGNFISQVPLFGGLDDAQQVSLQQKMGHTTLRLSLIHIFLMKSSVEPDDMFAGVVWGLYPVCLSLMLGACALTIKSVRVRAGQTTRMPLARVHRHAFGTRCV